MMAKHGTNETTMSYGEFKTEMETMLKNAHIYTPGQAGFNIWTDRMARLADEHPAHDARLENDLPSDGNIGQ